MTPRLIATLAGLTLSALSLPTLSHHGSNIVYDLSQSITVTGTVTEFQFVNPHTQILFEIAAEDGTVVTWLGGLSSSINLRQNEGWETDLLKPGDEISITGAPGRNDAPTVWVEQVYLNGEPLLNRVYTG
jgi:DNA/RNA endonuclease YhcR with UshA esterase domain